MSDVTMIPQRRSFGSNLRRYREAGELTQEGFGLLAGMDHTAVSHYEAGRHFPNVRTLLRMCQALNVTPNDLLGFSK